ncbi:hypothetical protein ACFYR1_43365 [Streptomyces canus]|uniref:hypothetical protein n=1 Tax=Streptomyces canus TaxID=58343 RepID=UPI00368D56C9
MPIEQIPGVVTAIRQAKGMVLSPDDPDSRSVGSFFTTPVVTADQAEDVRRRFGSAPHNGRSGAE